MATATTEKTVSKSKNSPGEDTLRGDYRARAMFLGDIDAVIDVEAAANYIYDEDFDLGYCGPDAWGEADFTKFITQKRSPRKGTHETRAYVLDHYHEEFGSWEVEGFALIELRPMTIWLSKFEVSAETSDAGLSALADYVLDLAMTSDNRRQVVVHVSEYDERLLAFWIAKAKYYNTKTAPVRVPGMLKRPCDCYKITIDLAVSTS